MYGTLEVGDRKLRITGLRPIAGALELVATGEGPVELAVDRVTWCAPDETVLCVIEPFRPDPEEAAEARVTTESVTVIQPIRITEVISVGGHAPTVRG